MSWTTGGRLKLLGGAVIALTFVAGGLSGAAMFRTLHEQDPAVQHQPRDRRTPDCPQQRTAEDQRRRDLRPYNNLGLTEQQTDNLLSILERRRTEVDAIWRRARVPVDSVLDETRREIRSVLTPEQRAEMDRRRAEWMKRDSVRREENRRRCEQLQNSAEASSGARPEQGNR